MNEVIINSIVLCPDITSLVSIIVNTNCLLYSDNKDEMNYAQRSIIIDYEYYIFRRYEHNFGAKVFYGNEEPTTP